MVTGVSYDFHKMSWLFVSESTQWWQSMSIVVIFGLVIATFLTLVVVPVLYSLNESIKKNISGIVSKNKIKYKQLNINVIYLY
jgi:Cation/multidrug efflux pump